VFSRIILDKTESITEAAIKESQYGFRQGRGTVDAIFIVRQVIEKAREHKIPLHFNFVDFKAAFDTIWRVALWKMLRIIGVPDKVVNIIENLYSNTECAVVINGKLTEWFSVSVGVRQGCLLSPTLFNIFLEFVMKEIASLNANLELSDTTCIDVRYADDTTLLSVIFQKLLLSTKELEEACKKWGMKVNGPKCKILSPSEESIQIDGTDIDHVSEFVFLGSVVPDTSSDVKRRIALASSAFGRLRDKIWSRSDVSIHLKVRLYNALIRPIAIYASETWTLLELDKRKLEVFEMRCLRAILGITILDRMRNAHIRQQLNIKDTITEVIKRKRLQWFGHVVRRSAEQSNVYNAYENSFQNNRPRGRPPKRWVDQIRHDLQIPKITAERVAKDREKWKEVVRTGRARVLRGLCQ
jgi:hypothetical protein